MKRLIFVVLLLSLISGTSFALRETAADYNRWLFQLPGGKLYLPEYMYIQYDATNRRIDISSDVYVNGNVSFTGTGGTINAAQATLSDATITNSTTTVGVVTTAKTTTLQVSGVSTLSGGATVTNAVVTNSTTTVANITTNNTTDLIITRKFVESYAVAADTQSLTVSSGTIIFCTKATPMRVTLPAASGNAGLRYKFVKTDAATQAITIVGNGSENINGSNTNAEMDAQYDVVGVVCDGDEWFIIERYIH